MKHKLKSSKLWVCISAVVMITVMSFLLPSMIYSSWVGGMKWIVGILVAGNVASKRYRPRGD